MEFESTNPGMRLLGANTTYFTLCNFVLCMHHLHPLWNEDNDGADLMGKAWNKGGPQ